MNHQPCDRNSSDLETEALINWQNRRLSAAQDEIDRLQQELQDERQRNANLSAQLEEFTLEGQP